MIAGNVDLCGNLIQYLLIRLVVTSMKQFVLMNLLDGPIKVLQENHSAKASHDRVVLNSLQQTDTWYCTHAATLYIGGLRLEAMRPAYLRSSRDDEDVLHPQAW